MPTALPHHPTYLALPLWTPSPAANPQQHSTSTHGTCKHMQAHPNKRNTITVTEGAHVKADVDKPRLGIKPSSLEGQQAVADSTDHGMLDATHNVSHTVEIAYPT